MGRISLPAQGAKTMQSLAKEGGRLAPSGAGELDIKGLLLEGSEAEELREETIGLYMHHISRSSSL